MVKLMRDLIDESCHERGTIYCEERCSCGWTSCSVWCLDEHLKRCVHKNLPSKKRQIIKQAFDDDEAHAKRAMTPPRETARKSNTGASSSGLATAAATAASVITQVEATQTASTIGVNPEAKIGLLTILVAIIVTGAALWIGYRWYTSCPIETEPLRDAEGGEVFVRTSRSRMDGQ